MLMVIFDILVSHRRMSKWHERRIQAHLREQQAMHTAKLELQQRLSSNAHASTSHSHTAAHDSAPSQGHANVNTLHMFTSVALMHHGACTRMASTEGLCCCLCYAHATLMLSFAKPCFDATACPAMLCYLYTVLCYVAAAAGTLLTYQLLYIDRHKTCLSC